MKQLSASDLAQVMATGMDWRGALKHLVDRDFDDPATELVWVPARQRAGSESWYSWRHQLP